MQGMSDGRRKETTNDGGDKNQREAERGWVAAVDKDESVVQHRCR